MIINTVYIARFQQFNHYQLELNKGWTNIYGGNESGKTTIALFIQAMLFGFKEVNRSLHLAEDSGGYLIITVNNKTYRLERYMHQNRGKATLILEATGEIIGGEEVLQKILSISLKDYKAIYYFYPLWMNQQKMTEDEWQSYALSYAMTGNDDLFQKEKEYQKKARCYQNSRLKQGKLTQLLTKREQLQQQIEAAKENDRQQQTMTKAQYEQLVSQKVQLEALMQEKEQYDRLSEQSFDALSPEEETRITQWLAEWENSNEDVITPEEWQQLTKQYKALQTLVAQYMRKKEEPQPLRVQNVMSIAFSVLFFIGLYMMITHHLWLGLFLMVMGVGLIFYRPFLQQNRVKKQENEALYSIEEAIQSLAPYIICQGNSLNEKLVDIRQQMRQLKDSVSDDETVHHIKEQLRPYSWLNTATLFSAKQSLATYYQKKAQYEHRKEQEAQLKERLAPVLNRSKEDIQAEYQRLTKEVNDAFYILQQEQAVDLTTLYQRRATLDDEIEAESIRYIQNQLKLNWINDLKDEQQQLLLPQVLQRGSVYFAKLTCQRYKTIFFKENQLFVQGDRCYQMADLSQGTKLQLMMALRLAFIMSQTKLQLPLMMDEGWAFFDMERSESLFYLLQTCSAEQQIITFSHYSLADYCQKEISL